ncbi:hypothetical protein NZNM25_04390 [Nitrosopumilus zosterae]|uniref:Uncharacterized protein n=1 Tax=Nitrosopumilus zosterae TaxID=718286 RepID=A0A2S2KQB8_9ARCH|nr:hypothetical protein [Nitrosopumilus zosterae]BDQ31441.1 hypothetical protein NZOSNM25_001560 [Nitrosopumilus zosterae]GBH33648.1 hypothetical protein NZNM25_04390 [Nitrosopumilus zosterae]
MALVSNTLIKILDEINNELINQISLAKNADAKIDTRLLFHHSKTLNDIIMTSVLSNENKLMLQKFSSTLVQDNTTVKSLRYEKQDLERVLSNLKDI